jgi:hypothetical protein
MLFANSKHNGEIVRNIQLKQFLRIYILKLYKNIKI